MVRYARPGDTVSVHYTGRLEDGTVVDTTRSGDPIEFRLCRDRRIIKGFQCAVAGMAVGEAREARVPPEQAYGERSERLRLEVPRSRWPEEPRPREGQLLRTELTPGRRAIVRVAAVEPDRITLDLNHPLAGRALIFDIELVDVHPEP